MTSLRNAYQQTACSQQQEGKNFLLLLLSSNRMRNVELAFTLVALTRFWQVCTTIHNSWLIHIPLAEELGGDGNGIVITTKDVTQRSGMLLVQWILKRLRNSGLDGKELQSFAWLMPQQETQGKCYNSLQK